MYFQNIIFDTEVTQIEPLEPEQRNTTWRVSTRNNKNCLESDVTADLVFITGVREASPRAPDISEMYSGVSLHSSQYRSCDQSCFVNKTVLIVGAGLSGIDIAVDISSTANRVLISGERGIIPSRDLFSRNVFQVGTITK